MALPAASASGAPAASTDWPSYERNNQHSSASFTDGAITQANASQLKAKWTFTLPGPTKSGQPNATLWGSPTVVGGKVYIGAGTGVFYALNATTGKIVWQRLLDYGVAVNCAARGIASTATVVPDPVTGKLTVYVAGAHFLYALDAATGAVKWKNSVGPWSSQAYYNWASPTVAGGRIFMGVSSDCEDFHVRAGAFSYSQHTGALQHTYYDMPAGSIGGSVWSSPATDGTSVWVTTGDPAVSSPQLGDSYAIVRLNASTMVKQDIWRTTDTAAEDFDFGSSPTLFPGTVGGKAVSLIGACNKNGMFYAWNRANLAAGPVWSKQIGDSSTGFSACLTSAAYDFAAKRLFIAGNGTTVNGMSRPGSGAGGEPEHRRLPLGAAARLRAARQPHDQRHHGHRRRAHLWVREREDPVGSAVQRGHGSAAGDAAGERPGIQPAGVRRRPALRGQRRNVVVRRRQAHGIRPVTPSQPEHPG